MVLSSWLQQTKREENKESAKWERQDRDQDCYTWKEPGREKFLQIVWRFSLSNHCSSFRWLSRRPIDWSTLQGISSRTSTSRCRSSYTFLINEGQDLRDLNIHLKGGKKPVGYFDFVIDPDSFGNTVRVLDQSAKSKQNRHFSASTWLLWQVENMFHVSFLVKQRVVCLKVK